ncbi:MFS transporter [Kribbella sp. NPDC051587]|uniref:MFS transporter n=1 Tax=Kribbella sp. NPDC051587 TaxID=3364119 RepID=UPI0037B6A796
MELMTRGPTRTARGTLLATSMATIMAAAIIAPSLPEMSRYFGSAVLVRLALTITSLAIAVSAPVAGRFADRWGRRRLLIGSLLLYAVAGSAGYFARDLAVLIATRVLLGLAVGGMMTTVSALITDWFDGPRRASFLGLQQAFASLGGVIFLPLAGLLAAGNWRWPFWIYVVAALIVPFAISSVRDERRTRGVAVSLSERPTEWPRVLGIYALALGATLVFFMAPTQLPFLMASLGLGPVVTGIVVSASTVTGILGALVFPAARRRFTPATITAASVVLLGVGWSVIGSTASVVVVLVGLLIGGAGVGVVVPNLNLRLSELARSSQRAQVLGGLVSGIFLGQFLSPLVAQPLIHSLGIRATFAASGLVIAVAGAAALVRFIHNERKVR